jgi:hypothetical protein
MEMELMEMEEVPKMPEFNNPFLISFNNFRARYMPKFTG